MSSRRSARASAASRQSYREDSDEDHAAPDDLTEDEYEQHDAASAEDDEPEPEPSDSDEQRDSSRSAKRRKTGSSTPSSRAAASKAAQNSDWAPGVTRVVAKLVGAPTTDHVPKGELSPNVLRFLSDLAANNDRDWFAQHDAVYRYCWTNFGDFVSAVLDDIMTHVDPTVPWLPTKDLVYRIYRDWFGPPKLNADSKVKAKTKSKPDQQRCNLWGGDDELKVAPKIAGVDKTHPDIHWLKLRSFCVIHTRGSSQQALSKTTDRGSQGVRTTRHHVSTAPGLKSCAWTRIAKVHSCCHRASCSHHTFVLVASRTLLASCIRPARSVHTDRSARSFSQLAPFATCAGGWIAHSKYVTRDRRWWRLELHGACAVAVDDAHGKLAEVDDEALLELVDAPPEQVEALLERHVGAVVAVECRHGKEGAVSMRCKRHRRHGAQIVDPVQRRFGRGQIEPAQQQVHLVRTART
ncbi:hypothetical protein L1887_59849 [Cichorium endivia]|nr:hypothetical protein L1887_59849 [Cichorium endivia]